jgi:hypothetical protein
VQLYSFSNYHWYMKQEFKYHDWELADLLWDPENPMNLTAICRYSPALLARVPPPPHTPKLTHFFGNCHTSW